MLNSEIVREVEEALAAEAPARGLHLVDHLLQTFPGHLRARTLRAKALLALAEHDEAAEDVATVLSADLLNVDAMLVSAKLAEARGDLHQSHALIGRAASVDSAHRGVRQAVADSVAMLPRDPAALGFAYLNSNWPDLAEREFRLALGRDPARVDLRIALAESLWRQSRFEEARPECRVVLDHHPRCLRATLMMAHILAEQGRTAHGLELLERAGEMDPEYEVAAELFARATLSRMSLPPPPSLSEPPAFPDHLVTTVGEPADVESAHSAMDSEGGAESDGDSPAVVFTAVDGTDVEVEGEKTPLSGADDQAALEAGESAGAPAVDESTADSSLDQIAERGDDGPAVDEGLSDTAEAAPSVEFSAGWPSGKGRLTAKGGVDEGEGSDPDAAMPPSVAGAVGLDISSPDETLPIAADPPSDGKASDEDSSGRSEVEPARRTVDTGTGDGTDEPATARSHEESVSIDDDEPAKEAAVDESDGKVETLADYPAGEAEGPSVAMRDSDPAESSSGTAVLAMARVGSWDSVVDVLSEMLADGEVEPVAVLMEELAAIAGFPSSIWRMLGDSYMRRSEPQLASEAYFRAVRRSDE